MHKSGFHSQVVESGSRKEEPDNFTSLQWERHLAPDEVSLISEEKQLQVRGWHSTIYIHANV